METRLGKYKNIRGKRVAEVVILLGLSIVLTILTAIWINEYNDIIASIFEVFSQREMFFVIVGLIAVVEGIYVYSKPEIIKLKTSEFFFLFMPYLVIFSVVVIFHNFFNVYGDLKNINHYLLNFIIFLFWISVSFEATKSIKALKNILKNSVKESKDRLSIVITVIATIISAIALLK